MKLSVEYPSVAFREGPQKVLDLAQAIEEIGYDEIAVFDHVVMGYPAQDRPRPMYPPQMPILEAVVLLAQLAAVTKRIGLSTEVLVLPQRQPVLVAKQIATIDTLSQGRVRLGVGVGWQESEYDALEEDFSNRGRRMDEAIAVLRAYWGDSQIDYQGDHYQSTAMAMEPKPPQGRHLPIWIGGGSKAALRRVAELGDGWMGTALADDVQYDIRVDGITCPFCVATSERALKKIEGVHTVGSNLETGTIFVCADSRVSFTDAQLKQLFLEKGFTYRSFTETSECSISGREHDDEELRDIPEDHADHSDTKS